MNRGDVVVRGQTPIEETSRDEMRRQIEHNVKNRRIILHQGDAMPSGQLAMSEIVCDRERGE